MQKPLEAFLTFCIAGCFSLERASAAAHESKSLLSFQNFVNHFHRTYPEGTKEYEERQALFQARAKAVIEHNRRPDRRWTAAINRFSDHTDNELARFRGWRRRGSPTEKKQHGLSLRQKERGIAQPALSKAVNWSFLNASGRNYNQGSCGSCWAIASSTVLEMHSEIHGRDRTFSAQELVSCVPNPRHCGGTGGCEGATIELAMEWVMKNGLSDDSEVPYYASDGECKVDAKQSGSSLLQIHSRWSGREFEEGKMGSESDSHSPSSAFGMLGWDRLPENQYEPLLHALQDGPVGVSVAASDWFSYASGIFDECVKDAVIDHAVVLIGYGHDSSDKYWLLKNSWGSEWGEDGFLRILRRDSKDGDEGSWCGIDKQPELGSGCDGGPSEVKVCGTCGILYDTVTPHFRGESAHAKRRALERH
jgi:cathepsin L